MTKNNQPLISVIIPVYNVEKYLHRCVDSILSQSYENIEIILVDDGSTDNSGNIADDYASMNENISVIHKKNGGLSSARNVGVKKARGQWVSFVDSDDYVDKDFIKKLYALAKNNDADIATCSLTSFSDDEGLILKKSPNWPLFALDSKNAINDVMMNKRPAYICLSLFNIKPFKDNGVTFPEGRNFEDIATRIKLLYYARKVKYTNERLYYYLIRADSITGENLSEKNYNDFIYAMNDIDRFLECTETNEDYPYLNYYGYCLLNTLMNYLARKPKLTRMDKKRWSSVRQQLRKRYFSVKFPSFKTWCLGSAVLLLASNMRAYSAMYRRIKK